MLVVGLGNTACEVSLSLAREASRVYQSYRHGKIIISRYDGHGIPTDLEPWPKTQLRYLLRDRLPWLARRLESRLIVRTMVCDAARQQVRNTGDSKRQRLRRAEESMRKRWQLLPCPTELVHPSVQDDFISALDLGRVTPVRGFRAFVSPDKVLLDDGSTIQADAVVFCTGYMLDFGIIPELEMDGSCGFPLRSAADQHTAKEETPTKTREEPTLPRLYHMLFPPRWAPSMAVLSWSSALETSWCVCELASMAVSQVWAADAMVGNDTLPPTSNAGKSYRKPSLLPTEADMNSAVDKYHAWWRRGWARVPSAHLGIIEPYSFYRFLHKMAGTGMYEHVNHSLSLQNWALRYRDRQLHRWLTDGPASSHAWRLFDTNPANIPGRGRSAWPGARQALREAVSCCPPFLDVAVCTVAAEMRR